MKRKLLITLLVLSTLLIAVSIAQAEGGGATVIDEFGCQIIPADWSGDITLFTDDVHAVLTPSGKISMTCHFVIPVEEMPVEAARFSGFNCGTLWAGTNNSFSVTSPDDMEVMLRCQVK